MKRLLLVLLCPLWGPVVWLLGAWVTVKELAGLSHE